MPVWPVYIVGDHPDRLTFEVAVDDIARLELAVEEQPVIAESDVGRRVYVTSTVRERACINTPSVNA